MSSHQKFCLAWKLWVDGAHSPAMNMALDEALLATAQEEGVAIVRFYEWDCPCFSIGCFQDAASAPEGFPFVRRPTGGGVVDHRNDVTYTVVFPDSHPACKLNREESYAAVNKVVVQALKSLSVKAELTRAEIPDHVDRRHMVCFSNPTKYDVILGNVKVAGAAQRRRKEGILHQGSVVLEPLRLPRAVVSKALIEAFTQNFGRDFSPFLPAEKLVLTAEKLRHDIYACKDWNHKR